MDLKVVRSLKTLGSLKSKAKLFFFLAFFVLLCFPALAKAWEYNVGLGAGTLGGSFIITKKISPSWGIHGAYNYFKYNKESTESDVKYDIDLTLNSGLVALDWYPFKGSFRFSLGVLINGNKIEGTAKLDPSQSYQIGDHTYTGAQIGSLKMDVDFNTFSPYVGIGGGFGAKKGLAVSWDIGIVYQGSPDVSLTSTSSLGSTFQNDLKKEEQNLEDDLSNFKYYPVVMLYLTYRF